MMLWIAKLYSLAYRVMQDTLHVNLRGIGYLVSKVKQDSVLSVQGNKFYFNQKLSSCYLRMLSGDYNEPETHLFVNYLAEHSQEKITILDIGANIGEMVIDFSGHPNISRVIAFEPNPECVATIEKSIALNGRNNIMLVKKAASDKTGTAVFHIKEKSVVSSSLVNPGLQRSATVETTTIDDECSTVPSRSMMLIDVEGAELLVLQGAKQCIGKNHPVIIFEYNQLGQQQYTLGDVRNELGERYEIFRLRRDGYLDSRLEKTWNCVAVQKESWAYALCIARRR